MGIHEKAGQRAEKSMLVNVPRLISSYYEIQPDVQVSTQRVSFGTSGHRGVSFKGNFNVDHIFAISQAVCDYRKGAGIDGPLYLGMDTHALSESAMLSALEVLSANEVFVKIQKDFGATPTPVISHAILSYCGKGGSKADGIVITPSHNPPEYGGFKYNPPSGGPAGTDCTRWIEDQANKYLEEGLKGVKRFVYSKALDSGRVEFIDYIMPYVQDLIKVIDMHAIAGSGLRLGVNPLGGSTLEFWHAIGEYYGLDLEVLEGYVDHQFGFMSLDHDGKIRMDCSSPYAMASLIALKDHFDLGFGNDPDGDRHGIVTSSGLLNPNHALSVAIEYLFSCREGWSKQAKVGKTLVSSSMIDRVAKSIGREVYEVPVGFKWFVDGLFDGHLGFGGEESAGASFLCMDGSVWSTDKDGMIPCLLAAECMAKTGKSPAEHYAIQESKFGKSYYGRRDNPAEESVRKRLGSMRVEDLKMEQLGGEQVISVVGKASGNGASIGGLKISTENAWCAVRPSGTEDIYKIYAESFVGQEHLEEIIGEVAEVIKGIGG